jgi:hypothetical protein
MTTPSAHLGKQRRDRQPDVRAGTAQRHHPDLEAPRSLTSGWRDKALRNKAPFAWGESVAKICRVPCLQQLTAVAEQGSHSMMKS